MVSFGVEDFVKKYGALKPPQFVDVAALSGDKADNIPGNLLLLLCRMVCIFFLMCEFFRFFWKFLNVLIKGFFMIPPKICFR
jgi:5'-3' exonuclease